MKPNYWINLLTFITLLTFPISFILVRDFVKSILISILFIFSFLYFFGHKIIFSIYNVKLIREKEMPSLYKRIYKLSNIAGVKPPRVGFIDDDIPNAMTVGSCSKFITLILTIGFFEYLSEDEQNAIILHELAHIKYNDVPLSIFLMTISIIIYTIAKIFRKIRVKPFNWLYRYTLRLGKIFAEFRAKISRIMEYRADRFSASINGIEPLVRALVKINKYIREVKIVSRELALATSYLWLFDPYTEPRSDELSEILKSSSSHPSIMERIDNVMSISNTVSDRTNRILDVITFFYTEELILPCLLLVALSLPMSFVLFIYGFKYYAVPLVLPFGIVTGFVMYKLKSWLPRKVRRFCLHWFLPWALAPIVLITNTEIEAMTYLLTSILSYRFYHKLP